MICDTIRYDTIRYDTIRYDTIRYDTIECDKALVQRTYFVSTLRVSWNLIEAEILHNPGNLSKFINAISKYFGNRHFNDM